MDYKTGLNIKTFEARAIIGRRVGYSEILMTEGEIRDKLKEVSKKIENYVFSGNLTKTEIVVSRKDKDYQEPAYLIETSIYPRFPVEVKKFKEKFIELIGEIAVALKQERVAISFSDESLMLETKYCKNPDIKSE